MRSSTKLLIFAAALTLPACSGLTNGTAQLPNVTQAPLPTLGKLTFAVGTAKLQDGSTGLNVVTYVRKTDGSTPFLVDTPSITGPTGFIVPTNSLTPNGAGGSGSDGGTATINATSQTASPPPNTTFGTGGGLYGGGLGPYNSTQSSSNFYPGNSNPSSGAPGAYLTPFYETPSGGSVPAPTDPLVFLVGPPAKGITPFNNVDFPSSPPFQGYLPGFTAFEAAPVTGSYHLHLDVEAANASAASFDASATLGSTTPLPAIPAPVFTEDASKDGGGTVTVTVPSDPRITETLVFFFDSTSKEFYTVGPLTGTGTLTGTLGANLGACNVPPCSSPTMAPGDKYTVSAITFDYPDFESIQPISTQQTPTVLGSAGQADISISPATVAIY